MTVIYEVDSHVTLEGSLGRIGLPPRGFDRKEKMAEVKRTLDFWNKDVGRNWEIHP